MTESNRIYGCFMGQLVGDAIGTRYEFMNKIASTKLLKKDTANGNFPMLGEGPFNVKVGQYTDDSELALGIWLSILESNRYDITNIVKQFYSWYRSKPFDIGRATRQAFEFGESHADMVNQAKANQYSLSNGCLMKISPIGTLNVICELTNPNSICIDMCVCYVKAIDTAIKTGSPVRAFLMAQECAQHSITKQILNDAKLKATPTKLINDRNKLVEVEADGPFQGYIGVAFQNAFYHLLNTPANVNNGFTNVMIHTVCLGGDVDTNACIAGALYGACHGYQRIQQDWILSVMDFVSKHDRQSIYKALDHQYVFELLKNKLK